MVEVDSTALQESLDVLEGDTFAVDSVVAVVVLESGSGDNQP